MKVSFSLPPARSVSLFAVLAFGVAACGDDVQIVDPEPTPPPALSVTLTPQQLDLTVGESGNLTVGITGGDPTAEAQVTCESSNTGVATVSASGDVCAVTAVAAGTATVTARVTKGNQTSSSGAAVTVTAPAPDPELEPATISIESIRQHPGGGTVDLDNAFGQLDVTLNLERNDETPQRVVLLVDGDSVASQTFTAAFVAEELEVAETGERLTLSFNTAFYEIVDGEAVIRTPNGPRAISAEVVVDTEGADPRASSEVEVTFRNLDGFHVQANFPVTDAGEINSAMDGEGRRWFGGWGGDAMTLTAIPVFYTGQSAQNVTVSLCNQDRSEESGPFAVEFTCANFETNVATAPNGEIPVITAQYAGSGNEVQLGTDPRTGNARATLILNVESADHPFPARIDNWAPRQAADAPALFRIARQADLENTGNWLNDRYLFRTGYRAGSVAEGGVGLSSAINFAISTDRTGAASTIQFGPGGGNDLRAGGAGLEETVTNEELVAWVQICDLLGNCRLVPQGENADADHPLGTFGYDVTPPDLVFSEGEDIFGNEYGGQLDERYSFVNRFSTDDVDGYDVDGTDILAGFNPETAVRHALVTVRGRFDGEGAIDVESLVGGTPDQNATPFTHVRADPAVPMVGLELVEEIPGFFEEQTRIRYQLGGGGDFDITGGQTLAEFIAGAQDVAQNDLPAARYYIYQVRLQDQAGNWVKDYRAIYLNNETRPDLENLRNPSVFDQNTTFTVSVARDSVELAAGALEIRYPNTLGTLVWERPGTELTSYLEMQADIQDGVLFNDVIYRPQRNVEFPLGLADLGLQDFLKSVQTLAPQNTAVTSADYDAMIRDSRPDSVRARVFNGWGVQIEGIGDELTLSSPITGEGASGLLPSNGSSRIISTSIQPEEVGAPTFHFHSRTTRAPTADELAAGPDWSFQIVTSEDPTVVQCPDDFCVRAIGPRSTFTNPFDGGPVVIVWADINGSQQVTDDLDLQWRVVGPADTQFVGQQPTRDSGDNRLYEWSFNLDGANPGIDLEDLIIAAIGIRPTGDAVRTDVFRVAEPPQEPDLRFQIAFGTGPFDTRIGGDPVLLPVTVAPGVEDGPLGLTQCRFLGADGQPRTFPPTGLIIDLVDDQGCRVTATSSASVVGTYQVRADAVRGDSSSFAVTEVEVRPFDFQITLAPSLIQLPVPVGSARVVDFEVTANDELNAFLCRLPTTPSGISIAEVEEDGRALCRLTINPGVEPGDRLVRGIGQRAGTLQEAQGDATLRLLPTDISFEAEVVLDASDPETLVVFDGPLPPGNFADTGEFRFGEQDQRFGVDFEVEVRFATGPNAGEVAEGVPVEFSSLGIRVTLESDQVLTDENGRARIGVTAQDQYGQAFVSASVPGTQRGVTYQANRLASDDFLSAELITNSVVSVDPASPVPSDGESVFVVTVELRNPANERIRHGIQIRSFVNEALSDFTEDDRLPEGDLIISPPLFDGISETHTFEVRARRGGGLVLWIWPVGAYLVPPALPENRAYLAEEASMSFTDGL